MKEIEERLEKIRKIVTELLKEKVGPPSLNRLIQQRVDGLLQDIKQLCEREFGRENLPDPAPKDPSTHRNPECGAILKEKSDVMRCSRVAGHPGEHFFEISDFRKLLEVAG
jgi:hypothetical protein